MATNEHGLVHEAVGQEADFIGPNGPEISFVVDAIIPDPKCDDPAAKSPVNGHFVQLKMHVSTASHLSEFHAFYIDPVFFEYIDANNVSHVDVGTTATLFCLQESEYLPSHAYDPGQQYTGSIVLDVSGTSGWIDLATRDLPNMPGWEWQF